MVLHDGANNFNGRFCNGGKGCLHVNFHKCIQKYLIDLSVPNFNVTDCRYRRYLVDNSLIMYGRDYL